MLYNPSAFRENDQQAICNFVQQQGSGLFITGGTSGLQSTFLPFLIYPQEGKHGVLRAHFARGNAHWKELNTGVPCLVVFTGENGYVTPNWYATKAESGKVVPTWNYEMVEVRGTATAIEDSAWLKRLLTDLTNHHEGLRPEPWHLGDTPDDFLVAQLRAVVGLEIAIEQIEGKWKMSQNKSTEDRLGVVAGFSNPADPHHNTTLASLVKSRIK